METKTSQPKVTTTELAAKKANEMREFFSKKEEPKEEEEETQEEPSEESEEEVVEDPVEEKTEEPTEEKEEEKPQEETKTKREAALEREIARLKADRRESRVEQHLEEITPTVEEEEEAEVTKAEARLFTAWRNEALSDLHKKFPKYTTDPKLWEKFVEEYEDRIPDLVYAKRKNIPITKEFFSERLMRVHKSVSDEKAQAKEEGKKEVLKTMSTATLMGAGSQSSQKTIPKVSAKKSLYQRPSSSLADWITKKT